MLQEQFEALVASYSELSLNEDAPGRWVVRGPLAFRATYNNVTVEDRFQVLIKIPKDYPRTPPVVQETGGRIPRDIDHHVIPSSGNFCLGAPVEVRKKFLDDPMLLGFINSLVVPFLYSYCYKTKYGEMPYGELQHGFEGIRQYYMELFGVSSVGDVLGLLKVLAAGSYRGHLKCPCGSGFVLRKCHGKQLRELMGAQSEQSFFWDMESVLCTLSEDEKKKITKAQLPTDFFKKNGRRTSNTVGGVKY